MGPPCPGITMASPRGYQVMTPRGTCARDFLASPTSFGRSATPARSLANQRSSICRIKGCYVADLARHPMGSCASSGSN
ncbi:hypothetical protein WJX84_001829 [Apatococcus fuscideae]|uniref:Uncharacterized protein n=1 Tax=Apatococcus fuscideae TaxID=2026836 RepID=A0AAW1SKA4_9CHLO